MDMVDVAACFMGIVAAASAVTALELGTAVVTVAGAVVDAAVTVMAAVAVMVGVIMVGVVIADRFAAARFDRAAIASELARNGGVVLRVKRDEG